MYTVSTDLRSEWLSSQKWYHDLPKPWEASENYLQRISNFDVHPIFPNWNLSTTIISVKVHVISTTARSLTTGPGDTWTQSLVTTFLSFNPRQYQSNHQKQDLLITTNKISHCLFQLQFIKSWNFTLNQPEITNSTHSRSIHTPTPHFQSTFREDLRSIFPSLESRKKILNSPRLLIHLTNIKN